MIFEADCLMFTMILRYTLMVINFCGRSADNVL